MNISSNRLGLFALFARCLIAACALMVVGSMRMPAQTASSHARHPSGWEEHFGSAQAAEKSQDYSTAEREYKAVLALKPDFAEVHMNLGLVYQLQDRIPEAMTEFQDRKSTRLNSSHGYISYAVFCLKKKKKTNNIYIIFNHTLVHRSLTVVSIIFV